MTPRPLARGAASWVVAIGVLAGCASPRPDAAEAGWTSGRLAVRIAADGAAASRSESAAFELRGNGDRGELRLLSPLGTVLARARWSPGSVELTTSDGERRFGDLDQLSRETFGDALPLQALTDWLAGRPWPGAPSRHHPDGFEQLGWQVATRELAAGQLVAQRQAAPAIVLRVRLDAPS